MFEEAGKPWPSGRGAVTNVFSAPLGPRVARARDRHSLPARRAGESYANIRLTLIAIRRIVTEDSPAISARAVARSQRRLSADRFSRHGRRARTRCCLQ
jgi:hypothetical protein